MTTKTPIDVLVIAEAYATTTAAEAAIALYNAVNHPYPQRSGEAWDTYRVTVSRARAARAEADKLAERLTGRCVSCRVQLTPGSTGNAAWCDFHDQTCDGCDANLDHPHGRTA